MSAISANLSTPPDNFSTTLSSGIASNALTIPLNSVAGLATEGIGVLFTKDANGDVVANSVEIVHWTGIAGNSLTLTNTGDRGLTGSDAGAQAYSAGAFFEVWVTSYYYASLKDGIAAVNMATQIVAASGKTTPVDADLFGIADSADSNLLKKLTWANLKATMKTFLASASGLNIAPLYAPQGFLINGKIVPTVSSNNLTVAIKTLAGADPSSSDPVYCRIGDTVRAITSALSVTKNAGTNWFGSGSSNLATFAIDYFVYLGYNTTDGVVIGFARFPTGKKYDDFNATSTNALYCAISTITTAASGDAYENVGRFRATLSATASFNWSVPTFDQKTLVQRPIFETEKMNATTTYSASGTMGIGSTSTELNQYRIVGDFLIMDWNFTGTTSGSASNELRMTIPLSPDDATSSYAFNGYISDSSNVGAWGGFIDANTIYVRKSDSANYGIGAGRGFAIHAMWNYR